MDILKTLVAAHSKESTDRIVSYIGADKDRFATLIKLFLGGEYRITQRAAWPLSFCVRAHPELIQPYFKVLLDNLDKPKLHNAILRNTVRLLQDVEIPKKFQGRVMNKCFEFVQAPETAIAVKAFSLTVLHQLSKDHPDILSELKLIIEDQWDAAPPAFRSRAKRILEPKIKRPKAATSPEK